MIIAAMYPCPYDVQERHDQNSALIVNDKIYSYEEAKLTGIKEEATTRFPERSLMLGMKELNIRPSNVDIWVFPTPKSINKESLRFFFSWILKAYSGNKKNFAKWFSKKVKFVPHQIAHASLGVFGSSFNKTAFLCLDGGGDFGDQRNYIFGEFKKNNFKIALSKKGKKNIGSFHAFIADALSFYGGDSGKVSGLAGYGKPKKILIDKFSKLLTVSKNGIVFNRKRYSISEINLSKIKPREYNRGKFINQYPSDTNIFYNCCEYLPQDIAASGEYVFKEKILELLKILKKTTNMNNLVVSGGVFQNVGLNKYINDSKIFQNVYFSMAAGDSGLALGSALYIESKYRKRSRKKNLTPFLGPSFTKDQIFNLLNQSRLFFKYEKNIEKKVASLLNKGNCIGWFQGKAEFGARSLGARSILADPRQKNSKSRINQLLKKRDWFMPYAPSMLYEHINKFLVNPILSPYMQIAFDLKKNKKKLMPSAVHIDGTSRVHIVQKEDNIKYWKLINEFYKLTKLPIILNTSFNRHGIPTISDPRQAIEHLLDGCMDYLAIENYLVSFKENRKSRLYFKKEESEEVCLKTDCIRRLDAVVKLSNNQQSISKYVKRLGEFMNIDFEYSGGEFKLKNKKIYRTKSLKNAKKHIMKLM